MHPTHSTLAATAAINDTRSSTCPAFVIDSYAHAIHRFSGREFARVTKAPKRRQRWRVKGYMRRRAEKAHSTGLRNVA